MRLLRVDTLKFEDFHDEDERPRYVVLSHRWIGSEITFQDVKKGRNKDGAGYKKIEDFARYIRKELPSIEWLWIDTCCIDKRSPDELSYSLNQIFYWYRNAELCIAHLKDVDAAEDQTAFEQSDWFRRGWTLQELLAPRLVVFVTKDWHVIGVKGKDYGTGSLMAGPNLTEAIARIT